MENAFVTFLKLEQANSKKQSTLTELGLRVNAMVNATGQHHKTRNDLAKKLKSNTAHHFEVNNRNFQEARRLQWTTHANLRAWFEQFKATLIDLGFARARNDRDIDEEGMVVFFPNQKRRIVNMDETDGSLDNTNGQRGGRKPMVFYAPDIGGGGTQANKSSYSPTIICGSNAAGEALPVHFQLKTSAKTQERERFNIEFMVHSQDINVRFGHDKVKSFPCSFGLNDKAGMNAEELEKYFYKTILPLFPDLEDVPRKRVIVKVDSGPGRMHLPMLASLRLKGLYVVPGLPNSTGKTQETDQNYGPFKTYYRGNLADLAQARFEKKKTIHVNDLPLIVFGGKDPATGIHLKNAFEGAFNREQCLSAWRKCGNVPLTMSVLNHPDIRHEVIMRDEFSTDNYLDPHGSRLLAIEEANHQSCDFLTSFGFDGSQLRMSAPRAARKRYQLTAPQSKERVEAIKKASTAGKMFYATHGQHLNSDEFFEARAKAKREVEVKKLEGIKEKALKLKKQTDAARAIIEKKGQPTESNYDKDFLAPELAILATWKLGKTAKGKKDELLKTYLGNPAPAKFQMWTDRDEDALEALRNGAIEFKDTALNVALTQSANAVKANVLQLDDSAANELMHALHSRQQGQQAQTRELPDGERAAEM